MSSIEQNVWKKLNPTLFKSLESATTYCKLRGCAYVEIAHWIHQILLNPDSDLVVICKHQDIPLDALESDVFEYLNTLSVGTSAITSISEHVLLAINKGWAYASLTANDSRIRGLWLLAAMGDTVELKRQLLAISSHFKPLLEVDFTTIASHIRSAEAHEFSYDAHSSSLAPPGVHSGAMAEGNAKKSLIAQFCTDLTEQARLGKIDPVVGRTTEIRTMIDILLRRRQNNPLLTGEAGVGKTAIVEGLALAITQKQVPQSLAHCTVLTLDVGALLAGASMKGEFEARLKGLIDEIGQSKEEIIIFIDEIHTLIGAGGQSGTGDAANLLKPALARGGLRTIGATTWSEYKKYIEKDAALSRRFQLLQIHEPSEAVAEKMLRAISAKFAAHHQVEIHEDAISAAVKLSARYIPTRQLPDKAISLLDTACARVNMSLYATPSRLQFLEHLLESLELETGLLERLRLYGKTEQEPRLQALAEECLQVEKELSEIKEKWHTEKEIVAQIQVIREKIHANQSHPTEELKNLQSSYNDLTQSLEALQNSAPLIHPEVNHLVVADIVAEWTGIPLGQMLQSEIDNIAQLDTLLTKRVIGQPVALQKIAQRLQVSRAGLSDPNKPVGVFLLVGPSGVGKTETALALADAVYGGERQMIAINMSEYQEAHTVSGLKGSPPGYVGYGEGGVLTEAVRKKPYSVVLLDEIEKAHPDVHELFFQVFDKGWMEDSEGRYIDFKNTIILLTSNVGAELIEQLCDDPALMPSTEVLVQELQKELAKVFPIAFLGRLTIIPYKPLGKEYLADIIRIHLDRVASRMSETQNIHLTYSQEVVEQIMHRGRLDQTGVRSMIHHIEAHILPDLAHHWFAGATQQKKIKSIHIDTLEGESSFNYHVCMHEEGSVQ